MFTTSRTRRALVAISGTALTFSLLAACGAESSADSPGTRPEEPAETRPDNTGGGDGDAWDRRLRELEEYDQEKSQPPYVGDPWEQRLRQETR